MRLTTPKVIPFCGGDLLYVGRFTPEQQGYSNSSLCKGLRLSKLPNFSQRKEHTSCASTSATEKNLTSRGLDSSQLLWDYFPAILSTDQVSDYMSSATDLCSDFFSAQNSLVHYLSLLTCAFCFRFILLFLYWQKHIVCNSHMVSAAFVSTV